MQTLKRYLEPQEVSGAKLFPLVSTVYRGKIDIQSIKAAFHHLFYHHPILRGTIQEDENGYLLTVSEGDYPELYVMEQGGICTPEIRELREGLISSGKIAQPILIKNNSKGYVVFGINHSVIDAQSLITYISEFWQLYTDVVNGVPIESRQPAEIPPPPSVVLKKYWATENNERKISEVQQHASIRTPKLKNEIETSPPSHYKVVYFNRSDSERIAKYCHDNSIGVGAFLSATMAVILQETSPKAGAARMRFAAQLDQRRSVPKKINPSGTTNLVFSTFADIEVVPSQGPLVAARQLKEHFTEVRKKWGLNEISHEKRAQLSHNVDIVLANPGKFPKFKHPEELEIVDLIEPQLGDENGDTLYPKNKPVPYKAGIASWTFNDTLRLYITLSGDFDSNLLNRFENRVKSCH